MPRIYRDIVIRAIDDLRSEGSRAGWDEEAEEVWRLFRLFDQESADEYARSNPDFLHTLLNDDGTLLVK